MSTETKTLHAIQVVDEILKLSTELTDEEITEARNKIGTVTGSWGVLWGLEDISRTGLDVDLYELKEKTLRFLQELREDRRYPTVILVSAHMRRVQSGA